MGDLLIRNIPDELRRGLADAAGANGESLSEAAKRAIVAGLPIIDTKKMAQPPSALHEIREALGNNLLTDEEHEEFMRIIEEGRKSPDRPAPEFE